MSYINFSITRPATGPAAALTQATDTLLTGFSREGGRLEFVQHTTSNRGPLPPFTRRLEPNTRFDAAAEGLLTAIRGANWVQNIVISKPDARELSDVTWNYRHGGEAASARSNEVPANVQAVIDAAAQFDGAVHTELAAPFLLG